MDSIVSSTNYKGHVTSSDHEMAGLLLLWLVMEDVCTNLMNAHVTLFSVKTPTVHWVQWLAAKHLAIAMQLVQALVLHLQIMTASTFKS